VDAAAFHLMIQLVRNGSLDLDDIAEIADRLRAEGETDSANEVHQAYFAASMPNPADEEREQLRARLKVVPGGGNSSDT